MKVKDKNEHIVTFSKTQNRGDSPIQHGPCSICFLLLLLSLSFLFFFLIFGNWCTSQNKMPLDFQLPAIIPPIIIFAPSVFKIALAPLSKLNFHLFNSYTIFQLLSSCLITAMCPALR